MSVMMIWATWCNGHNSLRSTEEKLVRKINLVSNRLVWGFFCVVLSLLCLAGTCFAGDLLEDTAFQTDKLTSSVLMDVTQAGERLVAVGERGIIIYSDDHGVKWTQAEVPVRETLTAVTFSSPGHGWAVGHGTIVLHSTDHGQSWDRVMDGSDINNLMVDSMEIVVSRKRQQLEEADELDIDDLQYDLEDAEANLRGMRQTQNEGPTKPLMDVMFFNDQEGLIVGALGFILRTADGGQTWTSLLDRIENPFGYHYYALAQTRGALFLFGEVGTMYRSLDKGQSWETLDMVYEGSLFGAVGDRESECVAAFGLRGTVVNSCDGGDNWQSQEVGPGAALNAGVILPDNQTLLAGMAGAVFVAKENLDNFQKLNTGFPGCLSAANAGDGHLVLVGLGGVHRVSLEKEEN